MADPVTGLLAVGLAARAAQSVVEIGAANEREAALELTKNQSILKHQQKTLANFDTTQKILDTQLAEASTRGVGLGSSSLEAIRRHTANVGSKRQENLDLEESIFESNIEAEKSNVKSTLYAELFGNAAATAADFTSARAKMPSRARA